MTANEPTVLLLPHGLDPEKARQVMRQPVCPQCGGWEIDTLHDERTGRTDHRPCSLCQPLTAGSRDGYRWSQTQMIWVAK